MPIFYKLNSVITFETLFAMYFVSVYLYSPVISAQNFTNSSSIIITWGVAPQTNGIFQGYAVYYTDTRANDSRNITVHSASNDYELTELQPWSLYRIHVRTLTLNGQGKKSHDILAWTKSVGEVLRRKFFQY